MKYAAILDGIKILELMADTDYDEKTLAYNCKVSSCTISRAIVGEKMSYITTYKISKALGVRPDDIILKKLWGGVDAKK